MYLERGKIATFPLGKNGLEKHDIVYLGEVFPNYIDSNIPELLGNDYVFLFSTLLNNQKDSTSYGHVRINIIRHDLLSYFNYNLRENASYIGPHLSYYLLSSTYSRSIV